MKTIGEAMRELREAKGLFLREVAAQLEIDPSLLSKIERGDKRPTRAQVIHIAQILHANEEELMITYLSDKVAYELLNEDLALMAMQVAEKKIVYLKKRNKEKVNPQHG